MCYENSTKPWKTHTIRGWNLEDGQNIFCHMLRKISNSYEKVKTSKCLSSLLTNQNSIHEEIKSTLTAGKSCYYSVQTVLSSRLLSNNSKTKIYLSKTIIMPVVLYGRERWARTLRQESRLRVFENSILRRNFRSKRDENGEWRRLDNEELYSCIVRLI